ncbi:MAG: ABC transporter permease [Gammaproteobacteria bacterium]
MRYWVAYKTIVYKEVSRFLRIWPQTILPPAVTMTLYFLIFGNLIGARIGEMGGFSYMQYIAPGIIMMSVITNSYSNVVSSFYSSKFQKHLEEMLVAPIPNWVILAGYITGGVSRGLMVGLVVTCVALFFIDLQVHSIFITILTVLCTSILFALGGFINGAYAKSFDDVSIIPVFILTPLTYLGGVFYSINLLPEFWRQASLANPILYMVNAFRYGILGESDIGIVTAFLVVGIFIVVLTYTAMWVLNKGAGIKQ